VRCAGAVTGTPDHNRHTTNHQTCTRGEALTSWLCRDPPQDAEAHQLHENPRHPKDENENQHHALSWFERLRQTYHSEERQAERRQHEHHPRSIATAPSRRTSLLLRSAAVCYLWKRPIATRGPATANLASDKARRVPLTSIRTIQPQQVTAVR
jgi:hypothetical protein